MGNKVKNLGKTFGNAKKLKEDTTRNLVPGPGSYETLSYANLRRAQQISIPKSRRMRYETEVSPGPLDYPQVDLNKYKNKISLGYSFGKDTRNMNFKRSKE